MPGLRVVNALTKNAKPRMPKRMLNQSALSIGFYLPKTVRIFLACVLICDMISV